MTQLQQDKVMEILSTVMDPEIPVNIVDLGLIYGVHVEGASVRIQMTLTTRGCPLHSQIRKMVEESLQRSGFEEIIVEIVWDPPWSRSMASLEARKRLGWSL
ncbi:MAG TPA: iron-sulfur cluster assembly protein [Thermoanaerobaculia bacterium]|mgnify:CR=1 FL=1|nr:iron-sulfur cluster assembly protein [Thermoanaerobaculia bacterium]HUM29512.1 iron-sulfur cluster assembly protein [Thermoanaerobaculia bacterium]HXK67895.1 iron-sulfur cluster assembly protein [Thermoanaerobaculia bacterium]